MLPLIYERRSKYSSASPQASLCSTFTVVLFCQTSCSIRLACACRQRICVLAEQDLSASCTLLSAGERMKMCGCQSEAKSCRESYCVVQLQPVEVAVIMSPDVSVTWPTLGYSSEDHVGQLDSPFCPLTRLTTKRSHITG